MEVTSVQSLITTSDFTSVSSTTSVSTPVSTFSLTGSRVVPTFAEAIVNGEPGVVVGAGVE